MAEKKHDHHHDEKPNKPANSNFRQQRLVAWQPIMSPPHVVACLAVMTAFFLPVGAVIVVANADVIDIEVRYDSPRNCGVNNNDGLFTFTDGAAQHRQGCLHAVNFTIEKTMKAPVFMYYRLTNFYQNHRRFAKSRSVGQLAGKAVDSNFDCRPFERPGSGADDNTPITVNGRAYRLGEMIYSPCGLVAWAKFNDTFRLYRNNGTAPTLLCDGAAFTKGNGKIYNPVTNASLPCKKNGITWDSDYDKFKLPSLSDTAWTAQRVAAFSNATLPDGSVTGSVPAVTSDNVYLTNGWYNNEPGHKVPSAIDEDTMVWMRTASLPDFRKLYRIIETDLEPGPYSVVIEDYYDVSGFGGTKSIALSTISWVGGKNKFLGVAYLVVGGLSLLLALVFLIVHLLNRDRLELAIASLAADQQ